MSGALSGKESQVRELAERLRSIGHNLDGCEILQSIVVSFAAARAAVSVHDGKHPIDPAATAVWEEAGLDVLRRPVPGGWIYKLTAAVDGRLNEKLLFVPHPPQTAEQLQTMVSDLAQTATETVTNQVYNFMRNAGKW